MEEQIAKWFGDIEEKWIDKWFSRVRGHGREITLHNAYVLRDYIHTKNDFKRLLVKSVVSNQTFCMSTQHFRDYGVLSAMDKLMLDFDSNNPQLALEDSVNVRNLIKRKWSIDGMQMKTGNKGAHLYYWYPNKLLSDVVETTEGYYFVKRFIAHTVHKLTGFNTIRDFGEKYDTLDRKVATNARQVARVPYSKHPKTGRRVEPINPEILYKIRDNYIPKEVCEHAIKFAKIDLQNYLVRKMMKPKTPSHIRQWRIRPCLANAMDDDEPTHNVRRAFLYEAYYAGWTVDQIVQAFEKYKDFDKDLTTYQVEYGINSIKEQGIKPFSCRTLKERDICDNSCSKRHTNGWRIE